MTECKQYAPDIQAQGDCLNCGHVYDAHTTLPLGEQKRDFNETQSAFSVVKDEFFPSAPQGAPKATWPYVAHLTLAYGADPEEGGEWVRHPSEHLHPTRMKAYIPRATSDAKMSEIDAKYLQEVSKRLILEAQLATARNEALEEAAEIAGTLQNTPMPKQFKKKYNETAIWGAGADNHAAKIRIAIRALKTPEGEG